MSAKQREQIRRASIVRDAMERAAQAESATAAEAASASISLFMDICCQSLEEGDSKVRGEMLRAAERIVQIANTEPSKAWDTATAMADSTLKS